MNHLPFPSLLHLPHHPHLRPCLQMIAESLLEALSYVELELLVTQEGTNAAGTRDFVEKIGANAAMEMPPSTLARDMGT